MLIAGGTRCHRNQNTQAPKVDETDPLYFGSPGCTRDQLVANPVSPLIQTFCVDGAHQR